MGDLVYSLKYLLFFGNPLLYYYINLNSSIMRCLFSEDIYLSFAIAINFSNIYELVSELFCGEFFLIFLSILLPIKSSVVSAAF